MKDEELKDLEKKADSELADNELEAAAGGYVSEWGETYNITDPVQFKLRTYVREFARGLKFTSRSDMKIIMRRTFVSDEYARKYPDVDRYINDLVEHTYDEFGKR